MASATGIPENNPAAGTGGRGEDEPLLGRAGDASQQAGRPISYNLFIGTGLIAQAGIWILVGIVWGCVLSDDWQFFSYHPLLNSAGLLLVTQGILILQPTHTASQKTKGAYAHLIINDVGILALIAGLVIIEVNKADHPESRFTSVHGIMGLTTYILIGLQALVGFTAFVTPGLYGGVNNAKSLYKYHRMSGYVVITLMLATVCAATQKGFINDMGIKLWNVLLASIIVLIGIIPRIKKNKLGL